MFEKVKKYLKIVHFSGTITLKDGTEVLTDGDGKGAKCSVQLPNATEPIPLPDGEYTLEDDSKITIKDGMMVGDPIPATEEEVEEEIPAEEEVEEEVVAEEAPAEEAEAPVEEAPAEEEVVEPTDVEKKITELEERIKALEAQLMSAVTVSSEKMEKLQNDFNNVKIKLETTDGAVKLPTNKVSAPLTAEDKRYKALTGE